MIELKEAMDRFAASLLALAMFATSGMIGGTTFLCLMDGQLRSECCCQTAEVEPDNDCAKLVSADGCCEVRVMRADHEPVRLETTKKHVLPVPLLAARPIVIQVSGPSSQDMNLPPGARGPPSGIGPPLFVWYCSHLI